MMKRSLFDTHCDTAYELYKKKEHLDSNSCHVALDKAQVYDHYAQFYAVWGDCRLDDEACFQTFLKVADYFHAETDRLSDRVACVRSGKELEEAVQSGRSVAILAVEDARLTAGKIERLDTLYEQGVRYLTLLWGGNTCIGGSHNTSDGLTDFGKQVTCRCFEKGLIPDISHASEQSADDVMEIALRYQKPFIATHSNAYTVYPHSRNLRDRHFDAIRDLGGIVGVSLCVSHLGDTSERPMTAEDVFRHVEYYLSRGGEHTVGFGADWDGTDLPEGISHVGELTSVAEIMARHNYTDELIDRVFFRNFYDFCVKNL